MGNALGAHGMETTQGYTGSTHRKEGGIVFKLERSLAVYQSGKGSQDRNNKAHFRWGLRCACTGSRGIELVIYQMEVVQAHWLQVCACVSHVCVAVCWVT